MLYSLKGFSSKFLIYKKLFKTTLSKYSSIKEYLNKVKQLTDQLKARIAKSSYYYLGLK